MPETLNVRDEGAIRIVELDRPEALNAFSSLLMDELADAFLHFAEDDETKVMILTGAGRAFSAGADLSEMGRPGREPRHGFPGLLDAIIDCPKPLIVAVNGVSAGIGATILGLADMALISRTARLRCPFSALGLTAEAGSTYLFPMLMGRQRASWFLLSAEWLAAEDVVASGLAMKLSEPEALMDDARAMAGTLAALPVSSLKTTKTLMLAPHKTQLKASILAENEGLAALVGSAANKEALRAFREKRDPDFSAL